MKKKIVFVIPTLFSRPDFVNEAVAMLSESVAGLDIVHDICVVANTPSEAFEAHAFPHPVTKKIGNLRYSISRALNVGAAGFEEYDYFCYVDEGVRMNGPGWLRDALHAFETRPDIGIVGCRPHSTFDHFNEKLGDDPLLYRVLWADGLLLTRMESFLRNEGFDEAYFADCELQDFSYRLHHAGLINLHLKGATTHSAEPFRKKVWFPLKFLYKREKSRVAFMDKWSAFEESLGFRSFSPTKLSKVVRVLSAFSTR